MRHALLIALAAAAIMAAAGCQGKRKASAPAARDLEQIRDSGKLTVLTLYGSTSYFLYRGEPMGYQYELAQQFAQSLGVEMDVEVAADTDELIRMLLAGEGDLIAFNLPVNNLRWEDSLAYCGEEAITHQVVVQRSAPKGQVATDVTQLVGKDIYAKPGKHLERLAHLDRELGGGIRIHAVDNDSTTEEDLITQVAQGRIPCTVADNDVAQLNRTYYPNLDIRLAVSFDQRASWAVRKDCPQLAAAADAWHRANAARPAYRETARRYFGRSKVVSHGTILSESEGRISLYDDLFRKYAPQAGWDWRLLAALAYTESNFNPDAVSWAGARGLMQLMPRTAKAMGMPDGMEADPEESVKAATRYIAQLNRSLRAVDDEDERTSFVLAAYNAGLGHVYDAMALAEKHGFDPHVWHGNVERFILLKSNKEYYSDPVCRNGYFRGTETFNFVRDIRARHAYYVRKIKQ